MPVDSNHNMAEPEPNSAAGSASAAAAASSDRPITSDVPCLKCGYNLRGLTADRCPECGTAITLARSGESYLPWLHRRQQGHLLAFWATVAVVLFRPQRLYAEFSRSADYDSAQRFRWWAIAWTFPAIGVEMWSWWLAHQHFGEAIDWLHFLFELRWPVFAFPVLMFLLLAVATGLPGYFFHPRDLDVEMQNRAIALSYYTTAHLPLMNLPALFSIPATIWAYGTRVNWWTDQIAYVMVVMIVFGWLVSLVRSVRRHMPDRPARAVVMAVLLPMLWLGAIAFIMLGLPALVFYIQMMLTALA